MGLDDDEHPLLLELASLRQTAARFQHEAHAASIKLQRHSLDLSSLHEHAAALEQENARLTHELGVLRAHPDTPHHPAEAQVQELSLALRRVSDKVALTENILLKRTSELLHSRGELQRARHTADGAYELAARTRAREEACKVRERELESKVRALEEELKMVDLVIKEYADLVRNLEGRKSASPTPSRSTFTITPVDNLQDGKSTMQRMLTEFSTESEHLHITISELNTRVSDLQMTLDAERITASHDRTLLSQTKTELDKLSLEDQTAAKMVARYMKFSQGSINSLQEQITTLRVRHASTITTLELQLSIAESQLASERARVARFEDALDELCEDLARESYGRRREVALRLALLSREEALAEFMRRWVRRAKESYARCYLSVQPPASPVLSEDAVQEAFHRVVSDAESLLSALDDDVQFSDASHTSGSLARMALSREAVETLRRELQEEVQKRLEAIRKSAFSLPNGHLDKTPSQPEGTSSPSYDTPPGRLLPMPNGNTRPGYETLPLLLPPIKDAAGSPASMVTSPEKFIDDPFVVSTAADPSTAETTELTIVQDEKRSLPCPSSHDVTSTPAVHLVDDRAPKGAQPHSPAVSILDLRQDQRSTGGPPPTDVVLIHGFPNEPPLEEERHSQVLAEYDSTAAPPMMISTPVSTAQIGRILTKDDINEPLISTTPVMSPGASAPPTSSDYHSTLLSELEATKHRYDTLQRAFRDCSLALKELKHTLASVSFLSHANPKLRQYLETTLARIDDYAEDARVELEIRITDEELTARGFETVLSVPGALINVDERAEVEASARVFVDGTDESVARALEKFGKKLEDVQHDVAVVKRAVHGLAVSEEDGERRDEGVGGSKDAGAGPSWTAWTANLLGANMASSRSPTPVQTFGTVMTSPRLRHATSLKQLKASTHESSDREPLAGLDLRIPIPSHSRFKPLGIGRVMEGPISRPRTLSAMYAVGGLRSSSVGFGVGLGGSPSPVRARSMTGRSEGWLGLEDVSSPLRGSVMGDDADDSRGELHDLGDVE